MIKKMFALENLAQVSGQILGERWASFTRAAPCVCRGLKTLANFADAAEDTVGQGNEGRCLNDRRSCRMGEAEQLGGG